MLSEEYNMPRGCSSSLHFTQAVVNTVMFYFVQVSLYDMHSNEFVLIKKNTAPSPWIPYYTPERHLDFDDECKEIKVVCRT